MDLMAIDSGETFGVDSGIESLFPCENLNAVVQKGAEVSQCVFSVLFTLARLERDLDCCGDGRGNRKANVWCCGRRWIRLWLRRDVDLFPVELIVVTIELRGIVVKVVHRTV